MGITYFPSIDLNDLRPYIDWSPFFLSWELRGKYPAIFDDQHYGPEARKIFDDANNLLDDIIEHKSLHARGVCGLFPANSVNADDIEVYADEERRTRIAVTPVVADPRRDHYGRFGVETGVRSLLDPRSWPGAVRGGGQWLAHHGDPRWAGVGESDDSTHLGLPADFLIDPDGSLAAVHYGAHADDQWSLDELLGYASSASP